MLEQKPHMKPPFSICGNIPPLWWVFLKSPASQTPHSRRRWVACHRASCTIGNLKQWHDSKPSSCLFGNRFKFQRTPKSLKVYTREISDANINIHLNMHLWRSTWFKTGCPWNEWNESSEKISKICGSQSLSSISVGSPWLRAVPLPDAANDTGALGLRQWQMIHSMRSQNV